MNHRVGLVAAFLGVLVVGPHLLAEPPSTSADWRSRPAPETTVPQYTPQSYGMSIAYYSTRGRLRSILTLNNKGGTVLSPRVNLYNRDGQRFAYDGPTIGPRSNVDIDLRALTDQAGPGFEDGSLRVTYTGRTMQLGGLLRMSNPDNGVQLYEQLMYPSTRHSNSLAAIWMLPNKDAEGRVMVTNTGSSTVDVVVAIDGSGPPRQETFRLGPWQLRVLDLRVSGRRGPSQQVGGVSVSYSGTPGAIVARGVVIEPQSGYSAPIAFSDPAQAKSSTYEASGVHVSHDRKALRSSLLARNIGSDRARLTGQLVALNATGEVERFPLRAVDIDPGETLSIDVDAAWRRASRLTDEPTVGLELEYDTLPGTVIVSASSMSADLEHVFEVPLVDPAALPSATGGYFWRTDETLTSIVSIKNVSGQASRFNLLIRHSQGVWAPGTRLVQPGETVVIDVGQIQRGQVGDKRGRVIPLAATGGQVHWSVIGKGGAKSLAGRMEFVDATHGLSSTYACPMPTNDIYDDAWIEPGYNEVGEGYDVGYIAMEQDRDAFNQQLEEPYEITDTLTWTSSNNNVAYPDSWPGYFWGASAGWVSVQAQGDSNGWEEYDYEESPENHVPLYLYADLQVVSAVSSVSQTGSLHMSVGDTGKEISVTVSPSNISVSRSLSKAQSSNPNGSCWVTLTIPNQSGSGTTQHSVTASGSTCSGIFNSYATAGGVQSGSPTVIKIPPQKLIQMMWGEAEGYNDTVQRALGSTAKNRFGHSGFGNPSEWNSVLNSDFQGIQRAINNGITGGPQNYLDNSVAVYDGSHGDSVGSSTCFWTPTLAQWGNVQTALGSGTTSFPSSTGSPGCFSSSERQIVVKTSMQNNHGYSAPVFLFIRQRSTTDPAVVEIQ